MLCSEWFIIRLVQDLVAGKMQLHAQHTVYHGYWRDATSHNYHYSKTVAVIINISRWEFV